MLHIRLLGQFDVRADGKRVVIPSRAGQSLLAYLVLTPGIPHRREKLAGLLWPDVPDEIARKNLRQELWRIRKAITAQQSAAVEYIVADEFGVMFDAATGFWLDVVQLERQLSPEAPVSDWLNQAAVYQGEMLPGFYDEWIVLERERVQVLFERTLQALLERLIAEKRWATTVAWSEKWIAFGQTPEPAFRALMLAYAALSDRAKMAASFERCRRALDENLGVEPSAETSRLYEQLLLGQPVEGIDLTARQVAPHRAREVDQPPAPGDPPFKGLQYFDVSDADLFYGREILTARLVEHVRETSCLTIVVGASGSGKSSIVRAGLIPAIKRGETAQAGAQWDVYLLTPATHPLESLAMEITREAESVTATATLTDDLAREPRSLAFYPRRLRQAGKTARALIVVDQFEELFTLCREEFEREAFIDNLLCALTLFQSSSPAKPNERSATSQRQETGLLNLVITIRADFYARLAQYPELREAVAKQQEYIGPMTADELRRAIEEPSHHSGWDFEPGLVDLILRDVSDEPGALPMLSHALLETWKRRSGRTLTLKGYAGAGGVRGAIAYTAETVYQELSADQQSIARDILLRLTELGEATEDTRRRAPILELTGQPEGGERVRAVLNILAQARLITLGEDTVEVAHEALIREWPTLRRWLDEDREGLRLHRQLTEATHQWELLERDEGALYRGAKLAQVNEWRATPANAGELNASENDFVKASQALAERKSVEREAQQRREVEAAQKLAETEKRHAEEQTAAAFNLRRLVRLVAGVGAMALVAAIGAAWFASLSNQQAQIALSRQLAAQSMALLPQQPDLAFLLSVEASRAYDTVEARQSQLRSALFSSPLLSLQHGHTDAVTSVAFSPDGKILASASGDNSILLWEVSDPRSPTRLGAPITGHQDAVLSVAFSPDGKTLASGSADFTIILWDVSDPRSPTPLGAPVAAHTGWVIGLAFSPNGKILASGSADQSIILWDVSNPRAPTQLGSLLTTAPIVITGGILTPQDCCQVVTSIAFSPDGRTIAAGRMTKTILLWDVSNPRSPTPLGAPLAGHTGPVESVAFSPDGKTLASGADDKTILLWDVSDLHNPTRLGGPLVGHTDTVWGVAFSPNGKLLASGSGDKTILLWDVGNPRDPVRLGNPLVGHTDHVNSVAFSPDGQKLASASSDQTSALWEVGNLHSANSLGIPLTGHTGPVWSVAFNRDGQMMASSSSDQTTLLWDTSNPTAPTQLGEPLTGHTGLVWSAAFSPDGKTLVSAGDDKTILLWDVSNPNAPIRLSSALGHTAAVYSLAFSPNGKILASAGSDHTIILWDLSDRRNPMRLGAPLAGHTGPVWSIAFSPDGKTLAAGSGDATVILWNVNNPRSPTRLGPALTGHTDAVNSVTFSPDGKTLASGSSDQTIILWDVSNPSTPTRLGNSLAGHTGAVYSVAFSPDGRTLASGSSYQAILLWDVTNPNVPIRLGNPLAGYSGAVYSVAFNPNGKTLASASFDGTVFQWVVSLAGWQSINCQRAGRNLSQVEWQHYLGAEPYRKTCDLWPAAK